MPTETVIGYIATALYFFFSLENQKFSNRNDRLVAMSTKVKRDFKKMFLSREKIKKPKISNLTTEKTPTSGFFEKYLRTILKIIF